MSALPPVRRRTIAKMAAGFAVGLALWFGFREVYERPLAAVAQAVLRAFERPPVTNLSARAGEILLDRSDFPPDSPRPGLPADDIHFNFVLLTALFALQPQFFEGRVLLRLIAALSLLFLVHVAALVWQVQSVYVMNLGEWSAAHYGRFARNLWAGGFHFYLIAGRFAAPFAVWWLLARKAAPSVPGPRRRSKR
ncbi:MAG TPA: hypothetical protein VGS00_06195 [Thermoanaerobaculia bacterium]|nr:hypothetical protein [Thermoanaerobaculia bacterium]